MWVKFYLRLNADCTQGDSTSDNSGKLLQRSRGKGQYIYMILVKGEYMQLSAYFSRKFLLIPWSFFLVTRSSRHYEGFVGFYRYEEIQELGS